MNKILLIVGAVIVIAGGATYAVTRGHDDKSVKVTNTATGKSTEIKTGDSALIAVDACDVLTEAAAKQVLGDGATKGSTQAGNASSEAVSVSNCVYTYKPVTTGPALQQVQSTLAAGVLVRAAKTQAGAEGNKAVFGSAKPADVQDVSGYGDKAFWNPKFGQLSVLKGSNYYIINMYKGVNATKGTLDQAKQLADAVKDNLK